MHGVSGSGKSFVAQEVARNLDAIILRADAIRKHITGTKLSTKNAPIYDAKTTSDVYSFLNKYALTLSSLGFDVVIDATYLKEEQRSKTISLFQNEGVRFHILSVIVSPEIAKERIRARLNDVSDADDTILGLQLNSFESLTEVEKPYTLLCDNNDVFDFNQIKESL